MFLDNKKSVGLDISDHTIEAVELEKINGGIKVISRGRVILGPGVVARGRIADSRKLARAIEEVLKTAKPEPIKPDNIVFGLPESRVYPYFFTVTHNDNENFEDLIKRKLKSTIPIKASELIYSYRILRSELTEKGKEEKILLIAAENKIVSEWKNFFRQHDLDISLFDIEPLAIFRGMFEKHPEKTAGLVDIGANTANISFFSSLGLIYAYEVRYGGDYFDKKIADALKIDSKKAEILKKEKGLNIEGKAGAALRAALTHLAEEIKRNINYYNKKNNDKVQELFFAGGVSKMKGLIDFFKFLEINAKINIGKALYFKEEGLEYVEAVGLAARGLEENWSKTDPFFKASKPEKRKSLLKNIDFKNIKKITFWGMGALIIILSLIFIKLPDNQPPKKETIIINTPASEEKASVMPEEKQEKTSEAKKEIIKVKDIGGPLNVRAGAGTNYGVAGQINPGEEYELLEEEKDWYKIKLSEELSGWVFSGYVEKKK